MVILRVTFHTQATQLTGCHELHCRVLTHSELAPLRASLVPMEHCITRFFDECDPNKDKHITLKEWGHCFGIKEGKLIIIPNLSPVTLIEMSCCGFKLKPRFEPTASQAELPQRKNSHGKVIFDSLCDTQRVASVTVSRIPALRSQQLVKPKKMM